MGRSSSFKSLGFWGYFRGSKIESFIDVLLTLVFLSSLAASRRLSGDEKLVWVLIFGVVGGFGVRNQIETLGTESQRPGELGG